MIRIVDTFRIIALTCLVCGCLALEARAQDSLPSVGIKLTIKASGHDRVNTPIRFELPEDRLGPEVGKALERGPVELFLTDPEKGRAGRVVLAQAERAAAGASVQVTFVLPDPLRKGEELHFGLARVNPISPGPLNNRMSSWSLTETTPGALDLKLGDKPVFRYNAAPVSSPKYGEIQHRDAYIHPAYSPSGALITGDFSSSHPHHRGFFLAYEKTRTGDLTPDFWNIHLGTGKIYSEGFDKPVVGLVTARFSTKHRWDAKVKATGKDVTVLRERWDVEAYDIPDAKYWLFDVTSTQQAVDRPLELLPYRYGGMAYRGPEPFVKGLLDVLTSESLNRKTGDQKPARWVDLTGPIADGSDRYAGAMIADHPSNPHYPTVARIHPTTLPFFCYVPSHDKPLTIATGAPTVFRYRVLIHDGHPDKDLDERIAQDFAEPPVVVVE
jgi:Methane oxygenase PmoA